MEFNHYRSRSRTKISACLLALAGCMGIILVGTTVSASSTHREQSSIRPTTPAVVPTNIMADCDRVDPRFGGSLAMRCAYPDYDISYEFLHSHEAMEEIIEQFSLKTTSEDIAQRSGKSAHLQRVMIANTQALTIVNMESSHITSHQMQHLYESVENTSRD